LGEKNNLGYTSLHMSDMGQREIKKGQKGKGGWWERTVKNDKSKTPKKCTLLKKKTNPPSGSREPKKNKPTKPTTKVGGENPAPICGGPWEIGAGKIGGINLSRKKGGKG